MKCPKNDLHFVLLSFKRIYKNDFAIFLPVFSIQVLFLNKMPKILGIFLKISGLMENPDPGNDVNKAIVPNALGVMALLF